jgi:hypothetical protein
MKFNVGEAFSFYEKYILGGSEKRRLQEERNFKPSVPSSDWELLGAILVGENASAGNGADLESFEVKSSADGSFEYQYHRKSWKDKLKEDMSVDHLLVAYDEGYRDIEVWAAAGDQLKDKFKDWIPEAREAYSGEDPDYRFRRNITLRQAKERGANLVMAISDGQLTR